MNESDNGGAVPFPVLPHLERPEYPNARDKLVETMEQSIQFRVPLGDVLTAAHLSRVKEHALDIARSASRRLESIPLTQPPNGDTAGQCVCVAADHLVTAAAYMELAVHHCHGIGTDKDGRAAAQMLSPLGNAIMQALVAFGQYAELARKTAEAAEKASP